MHKRTRGISLVQLIVSVLLGAIVIRLAMGLFSSITSGANQNLLQSQAEQELRRAVLYLKTRLGGTRNFQSIGFAVPAIPVVFAGGQTFGPGFFVVPDQYCDGSSSASTGDVLYGVVKLPSKGQLKLAADLPTSPNPATVSLMVLDPALKLSDVLTAGDILVLTSTTNSDTFSFTENQSSIPVTNAGNLTLDYHTTYSPSGVGTATHLNNNYISGDYLERAQIIKVCLDRNSKELRAGGHSTGAPYDVLARNVSRFLLSYNLKATGPCPSVVTSAPTAPSLDAAKYKRDQWTILNSTPDYTCYSRLLSIRLDIDIQYQYSSSVTGRTVATSTSASPSTVTDYIFTSNFNPN